MIVLGVDPGFATMGIAAVAVGPVDDRANHVWVVRTEKSSRKANVRASEDNVQRARLLSSALEIAVAKWGPVAIAAETMSWPRNAGAAAMVALAWGVLCGVAQRSSLPIVQASPQQVKYAMCGVKTASKEEVIAAVRERGPELELPKHDHAAGARGRRGRGRGRVPRQRGASDGEESRPMKPLLVGESNPYSVDPAHAFLPWPRGAPPPAGTGP